MVASEMAMISADRIRSVRMAPATFSSSRALAAWAASAGSEAAACSASAWATSWSWPRGASQWRSFSAPSKQR